MRKSQKKRKRACAGGSLCETPPMNEKNYNTDENVSLIIKAAFDYREASDFVAKAAIEAVKTGAGLPEEFADLFTLEIVTRPSGSKYGVLDFA